MIGPSLAAVLTSAVPWLVLVALGLLVALVGLGLLIAAMVRRRRPAPVASATPVPERAPPAGGTRTPPAAQRASATGTAGPGPTTRLDERVCSKTSANGRIDLPEFAHSEWAMEVAMQWVWTILGALLAGCIIGPLARLVMPGKQNVSVFMTIVIGAVGALVGGVIATRLGVGDTRGIDWIKLAIEVIVAVIVVMIYLNLTGKKSSTQAGRRNPARGRCNRAQ